MKETEWVEIVADRLRKAISRRRNRLEIKTGVRLAYGHEITCYEGSEPSVRTSLFQTDMLVVEIVKGEIWRPRVVVEAKIDTVTTHDAITYCQKAIAHQNVHPYLRYGIMLGNRGTFPLPGRLFRHGSHFDFMFSFRKYKPTTTELSTFSALINREVAASEMLERILYDSRKRGRDRYTLFHRRLELK